MKKNLLFLLLLLFCNVTFAKDFNEDQLNLRQNIMNFLTEEGFAPSLDSEGDIRFKMEGATFYVIISEANKSPMYLAIHQGFTYSDVFSKDRIQSIINEVQLYKGLKLMIYEKSYSLHIEMFLVNAEHFCYTFYKNLEVMKDGRKRVKELISEMDE